MPYLIALLRALFSLVIYRLRTLVGFGNINYYRKLMLQMYIFWLDMYPYAPYASVRRLIYYWVLYNWYVIKVKAGYGYPNYIPSFTYWWDKWGNEIKVNNRVRF